MPIEGIRFLEVDEMTGVRHHDERGRRDCPLHEKGGLQGGPVFVAGHSSEGAALTMRRCANEPAISVRPRQQDADDHRAHPDHDRQAGRRIPSSPADPCSGTARVWDRSPRFRSPWPCRACLELRGRLLGFLGEFLPLAGRGAISASGDHERTSYGQINYSKSIEKSGDFGIPGVAAQDLTHYGLAATEGRCGG
jgi:hypothetical protein